MSRNTVTDGTKSFDAGEEPSDRVRREGGGGPRLEDIDEDLLVDLDDLVEPDARGDPMSPLRWTLKSTRQLAKALRAMGHQVSSWKVAELLHLMEYRLQATAKVVEEHRLFLLAERVIHRRLLHPLLKANRRQHPRGPPCPGHYRPWEWARRPRSGEPGAYRRVMGRSRDLVQRARW